MNRALARAAALVLATGAVLATRPAAAFVRYKTDLGVAFFWPASCVPVTVYPNDFTDLTPTQTVHAVEAAAAAWGPALNESCTFLNILVTSSDDTTRHAGFDYRNVVVFRQDAWCKVSDMPGMCSYDPAALAITSVFVSTKDGRIRDGDIEVNAKYFVWSDYDLDPSGGKQDLQNALTHEMGHLIGLDHTCYMPGTGAVRPFDNAGNAVPDCSTASEDVRATTMFASATPGDVAKRTLAPDDHAAVCAVYPAGSDPGVCPPPGPAETTACACGLGGPSGGGGARTLLGALLAGASLLWAGRRRRGQPGQRPRVI